MNIALVSKVFGSKETMSFGPYPLIRNIATGLAEKNNVDVYSPGWPKKKSGVYEGTNVFRSPIFPNDRWGITEKLLGMMFAGKIAKGKYDIINSQDSVAGFLFETLRKKKDKTIKVSSVKGLLIAWKKVVAEIRDSFKAETSTRFRVKLEEKIIENSDYFIVPSEFEKNELIELTGVEEEKVKVIYNGVNTEVFKPSESRTDENVILFGGGESTRKGSDLLFDAFAELKKDFPNLKLQVIGTDRINRLKEKIGKAGLIEGKDIICLGRVAHNKMPEVINNATIIVNPSYHETFGSLVVEAMACEKPCIVSDSTAMPEIVGDGAVQFKTGNSDNFAEKLKELLSNESKRKELGKKARERVLKEFKVERVIDEYQNYFSELTGKN